MLKKNYKLFALLFSAVVFSQSMPVTKKTPTVVSRHNISFTDDYAWLEAMESESVINWRNAQNEFTNLHLEEVKKKWSSAFKIKEYDHYSSNAMPKKLGKYYYLRLYRDKNKAVSLFYKEKLNDYSIELANPFKIYKDERVRLVGYKPSTNSMFVAVEFNKTGGDKSEMRFVNISTKNLLDDTLLNVNSSAEWFGDEGVFYKRNLNLRTFEKDSTSQLFYHKIGTPQTDDTLVLDATASGNSFGFKVWGNKLILIESDKDQDSKNYYQATLGNTKIVLEKFLEDRDSNFKLLNYRDGRVYFSTKAFDWGEVRSFDINNPKDEKVVVPQIYTHLLTNSGFYGDYLVCEYKVLGKNYLIVYDKNGGFVRRFDVPYSMDFRVNFYNPETKNLFVTFYSYTIPYLNYTLNIETGQSNPYFNDFLPPMPTLFPFDHFVTTAVTYKSRDGEDVPITIVYKKGLSLDGNNPTLLTAYGGYGVVNGPNYNPALLYFLEKGGVFAFAHVRGGGEKGRKWQKAGQGINKPNTFNDFIDAAEFLIAQKYTSPQKLGITGGSHGGLVVGVAMTKRPDLFKVVIPKMGVFDIAQTGKFTYGEKNYYEYGNPEIEKEYESLLGYSPFNNIKDDVNYPTTLIITSENDDRVAPAHSYKFAAKLQNRTAQKNPIYLKTLQHSGHSGSTGRYADSINEEADFYNFLLYHLNE